VRFLPVRAEAEKGGWDASPVRLASRMFDLGNSGAILMIIFGELIRKIRRKT
jgi:hypothetical protein